MLLAHNSSEAALGIATENSAPMIIQSRKNIPPITTAKSMRGPDDVKLESAMNIPLPNTAPADIAKRCQKRSPFTVISYYF